MIKAPVKTKVVSGHNVIYEKGNVAIGDMITTKLAQSAVHRINAYDELFSFVNDYANVAQDECDHFENFKADAINLVKKISKGMQ